MRQVAPYPDDLAAVVDQVVYRPGWSFRLDPDCGRHAGARGLTLIVQVETVERVCAARAVHGDPLHVGAAGVA